MSIPAAYPIWVILGLLIPGIITGIVTQSFEGALMGVLWGGFVRICVLQQVTYSVNSICHLFGKKNHEQEDNSRDNWILGILALGEGWHNSHHAFPTSARHGLKAWRFDLSYLLIILLTKLGVTSEIKLPRQS